MKTRWPIWFAAAAFVAFALATLLLASWFWQSRWEQALAHNDAAFRADALRRIPATYQRLIIQSLGDNDPDLRLLAALRLDHLEGDTNERAFALVPLLNDSHAGVRRQAAWTLARIGASAWPALEQALQHENSRVRTGATLALRCLPEHALPPLAVKNVGHRYPGTPTIAE